MKKLTALFMLIFLVICGCKSGNETPKTKDWTENFSNASLENVTQNKSEENQQTAQGEKEPTVSPQTGITEEPETMKASESDFIPNEGQVELLLLDQYSEYMYDGQLLDALNKYLQENGYNFYLSARFSNYHTNKFKTLKEAQAAAKVTVWEDIDNGIKADFVIIHNSIDKKVPDFQKAVTEGYIIPFSEYPKTEAAASYMSAYPEEYRKFSSFLGECYGWYQQRVSDIGAIFFDLDAFEKINKEVPESLDFENLDSLLSAAAEKGILPLQISGCDVDTLIGYDQLNSGLFLKRKTDGSYCFINPLEDEKTVRLLDALYRYQKNGWIGWNEPGTEKALINFDTYLINDLNGEILTESTWNGEETREFRIQIYQNLPICRNESKQDYIMALATVSEHKEEAVELLNLLYTDENVIKILRYGYEGFHYVLSENGPEALKEEKPNFKDAKKGTLYEFNLVRKRRIPDGRALGNVYKRLGVEEEWGKPNYEEWLPQIIDNTKFSPFVEEFTEEQKEKLKEIKSITRRDYNYSIVPGLCGTILNLNSKNFEEDLVTARAELEAAGYNELIDEMNRKYGFTMEETE